MAATVYDATIGAVTIKQVMRGTFSPNAQVIPGMASGTVTPAAMFGGSTEPQWEGESADVAGVIAGLSVTSGLAVSSGSVVLPWNEKVQGGTFESGSNHNTVSGSNGLAIPTSFSAQQDNNGSIATANLRFYFRSTNGIALPYATNTAQSLSAASFNAQYALGPVQVNGNTISQVTGFTVNTGLEQAILIERFNGGDHPQLITLTQDMIQPTIELQFASADDLANFANAHTVMTSAVAYFRKRSGASFVADGTAQHIKFSFASGIITHDSMSGDGLNTAQFSLRLHGLTLTATSTSAIT